MQDAYDCFVCGSGVVSARLAQHLAEFGLRTAWVREERGNRSLPSHWLVPRELLRHGPALDSVRSVLWEQVFPAAHLSPRPVECAVVEAGSALAAFAAAAKASGVTILAPEMAARTSAAAKFISHARLAARQISIRSQRIVWGHYADVALDARPSGATALSYLTAGEARFWLVPVGEGITSVGVEVPEDTAPPLRRVGAFWEEMLVRCPLITERLLSARLLGPLYADSVPLLDGMEAQGLTELQEWPIADCDSPSPLVRDWPTRVGLEMLAEQALGMRESKRGQEGVTGRKPFAGK